MLGIGLAAGEGVGIGLLVAIFVSNLPEAIGSASDMREPGASRRKILRLWAGVAAICTLATVAGYAIADAASGELRAGDRRLRRRRPPGHADRLDDPRGDAGSPGGSPASSPTLGFAVATALSSLS